MILELDVHRSIGAVSGRHQSIFDCNGRWSHGSMNMQLRARAGFAGNVTGGEGEKRLLLNNQRSKNTKTVEFIIILNGQYSLSS